MQLFIHNTRTIYIVCYRLKMSFTNRLELSVGNEVLRPNEDRRLVAAVPLRDRMVRRDNGVQVSQARTLGLARVPI